MRWPNADARRQKLQEERAALVNIPRKCFAWLPVDTSNGTTVWLSHYWKMYRDGLFWNSIDTIWESNYDTLEDAERAKR